MRMSADAGTLAPKPSEGGHRIQADSLILRVGLGGGQWAD